MVQVAFALSQFLDWLSLSKLNTANGTGTRANRKLMKINGDPENSSFLIQNSIIELVTFFNIRASRNNLKNWGR